MNEPVWVTEEDCLSFHDKLLARFGGASGVRDKGLLLSALARPQHVFAYETPSLFDLAAAYAHGIVKNHPFIDGNKRIAFQAMYVFLALNGQRLTATARNAADTIIALAAGELDEGELAGWIRAHVAAAPDKDA